MRFIFLYIHWNINPEIFNFLGYSFRYYGILFVTGLILSSVIIKWVFVRENLPLQYLDTIFTYGVIGIFAGARLGHCLFYEPGYYFHHPLEIFLPIQPAAGGGYKFTGYQGLASHGGTLGLAIALFFYARKTKIPLLKVLDIIAIVAPVGAFFIRIANLMNSEIIGTPTQLPWAFIFVREDDLPRHPAQLYEALAYLLIFGLLFWLYKRQKVPLQSGILFGLCITLIFTARFFIEFVKEKQVSFEQQMSLDMGQVLSIPFFILGLGFIWYGIKKSNRASRNSLKQ